MIRVETPHEAMERTRCWQLKRTIGENGSASISAYFDPDLNRVGLNLHLAIDGEEYHGHETFVCYDKPTAVTVAKASFIVFVERKLAEHKEQAAKLSKKEQQRQAFNRLVATATALADELESEIRNEYQNVDHYPIEARRLERDLDVVVQARAAIQEAKEAYDE